LAKQVLCEQRIIDAGRAVRHQTEGKAKNEIRGLGHRLMANVVLDTAVERAGYSTGK